MSMEVIESYRKKCAIALGNFDGLHKAHIAIIRECKSYAKKNKMKCGVLLFDRHTSAAFGKRTRLLTDLQEKIDILKDAGVDFVHIMTFDKETANLESTEFIDLVLKSFNVHAFFAGYDYTFGRGAEGTAESLAEYGKKKGFETFITPCIKSEDEVVSSTLIRELLKKGKLDKASELLGRYYSISGEVVEGTGRGKKELYPTANITPAKNKFWLPDGVYAGIAEIEGRKYRAAVNIGKNPTLEAKKKTIEAFILDYDGNLYGKNIRVEFLKKLRADEKFESLPELKTQIKKDISAVRRIEIPSKKYFDSGWKEKKMYLIVGLGNPGKEYNMTRHNIGFETVDYMAVQKGIKINKLKFKGLYGECNIAGERVIMLKPQTYMNRSGQSVKEICSFYKIPAENVIVICDDISIPAGKIRIRAKGGAGGHNGLKSIIYDLINDNFMRVRMGVGGPETDKWDLADFVLGRFGKKDIPVMEEAIIRAMNAVEDIIKEGVEHAMNKYNGMK